MTMLGLEDIALFGLIVAASLSGAGAAVGIAASLVPRFRDGSAARLKALAWVCIIAAGLAAVVYQIQVPLGGLALGLVSWISIPSVIVRGILPVSIVGLGMAGLAGVAALVAGFAAKTGARQMRGVGVAAVLGPIVLFGPIYGPVYYTQVSKAWWADRAPLTPYGRVVRVEMHLDFGQAGRHADDQGAPADVHLATWDDPEFVRELVSLVPWTDPGPGYGFKCQDGSPFALVFVTQSGEERVVILACDDCGTSGPAWDRGIGWETPRLLARVGRLLVNAPAAQAYAAQFDEDERRYHANWLFWAEYPYDVHDSSRE